MQTDTRPIQPIVAAKALAKLVRDPQDTPQVFHIINALRGRSTLRRMERFRATPHGHRLMTAAKPLLAHLSDHDRLAAMPPGSLGRTYAEFHAEANLSAEGLAHVSEHQADARMDPDELKFYHRMRDTHDLLHVLTGYGRSPLGEVCVLAFTHPQQGGRGIVVISIAGMLKITRERPGIGVPGAVWEAYRRGRAAEPLEAVEWETLLDRPIAELRTQFRIGPAPRYEAAIAAAQQRSTEWASAR